MNKFASITGTVLLSMLVVACGSNPPKPDESVNTTVEGAVVNPVTIDGIDDGTLIDPDSIAGRAPKERVIFFDFNKSEIRPEYLDIITQHGRYLAQNPTGRARLEGHTDERGSREYNIAEAAWDKNRRVNIIYEVEAQN